jgi:hypothetical protein
MHFAISNPRDFDGCRAKPVCVASFSMIPENPALIKTAWRIMLIGSCPQYEGGP